MRTSSLDHLRFMTLVFKVFHILLIWLVHWLSWLVIKLMTPWKKFSQVRNIKYLLATFLVSMFFLAAYFLSSYLHLSSQKLKVKIQGSILNKFIFFSRMELSGRYLLCGYFFNNNWFWWFNTEKSTARISSFSYKKWISLPLWTYKPSSFKWYQ